jgi:predicted HicB family RNase H-like nuclease
MVMEIARYALMAKDKKKKKYSGKIKVHAPRYLHAALIEEAKCEGVSFELFVTSVLAAAVGKYSLVAKNLSEE